MADDDDDNDDDADDNDDDNDNDKDDAGGTHCSASQARTKQTTGESWR